MKKAYFLCVLALLFSSNAFSSRVGKITITGKIVPPACELTIDEPEVKFEKLLATNVLPDIGGHSADELSDFRKQVTLSIKNCFLLNKKAYITLSGTRVGGTGSYSKAFANAVGDEYATNVAFFVYNKPTKNGSRTLFEEDSAKVLTATNPLTGEGDLFLDIDMVATTSNSPSTGKISVPLVVNLTLG